MDEKEIDELLKEDDIEENDDVEETKEEPEEQSKEEPKKTKQSRETNSYYAELRRKNEELEKEKKVLESQVKEARFSGQKDAISQQTLTDLGIDKIETDDDLFLCQEYQKAVRNGSDNPLLEANKAYRKRISEAKAEKKAKEDEEKAFTEKILADKDNLKKTYNVNSADLIKNQEFMDLFGDTALDGNLTKYYGKYIKFKEKFDNQSQAAKKQGVLPNATSKKEKTTSILDLEGEEFLKAYDKMFKD